jgi:hypothetical protein
VWPYRPDKNEGRILQAVASLADKVTTLGAQLNKKLDGLKMGQAEIEADVQAISGSLTSVSSMLGDVNTQASSIASGVTEIAQQLANGQTIDTTSLDALVQTANSLASAASSAQSQIDSAASSVSALASPPQPTTPTS